MTSNMRKYNISICGIQEHRKVHSADKEQEINRYDVDPGYDLYTVSAWTNQEQAVMVAWVSSIAKRQVKV